MTLCQKIMTYRLLVDLIYLHSLSRTIILIMSCDTTHTYNRLFWPWITVTSIAYFSVLRTKKMFDEFYTMPLQEHIFTNNALPFGLAIIVVDLRSLLDNFWDPLMPHVQMPPMLVSWSGSGPEVLKLSLIVLLSWAFMIFSDYWNVTSQCGWASLLEVRYSCSKWS